MFKYLSANETSSCSVCINGMCRTHIKWLLYQVNAFYKGLLVFFLTLFHIGILYNLFSQLFSLNSDGANGWMPSQGSYCSWWCYVIVALSSISWHNQAKWVFIAILSLKCNENHQHCNLQFLGLTERVKKGFFKLVRRLPYLKDRVRNINISPSIHKITLHYILYIYMYQQHVCCIKPCRNDCWLILELSIYLLYPWIFAVQPVLLKAASFPLYKSTLSLLMPTDS